MSVNFDKPAGSPSCWGTKYQDGERECMQCRYVDSCKPVMLARLTSPNPDRVALPVYKPNYSPPPPPPVPTAFVLPPRPTVPQPTAMVPLPAKTSYYPPAVSASVPLPKPPTPVPVPVPQPQQQAQASQGYYQQSTGWSVPNHKNPNPLVPLHRPGSQGQVYYLMQFPGESVLVRVIKNVFLRVAEALFGELLQFVRQWAWPPMTA